MCVPGRRIENDELVVPESPTQLSGVDHLPGCAHRSRHTAASLLLAAFAAFTASAVPSAFTSALSTSGRVVPPRAAGRSPFGRLELTLQFCNVLFRGTGPLGGTYRSDVGADGNRVLSPGGATPESQDHWHGSQSCLDKVAARVALIARSGSALGCRPVVIRNRVGSVRMLVLLVSHFQPSLNPPNRLWHRHSPEIVARSQLARNKPPAIQTFYHRQLYPNPPRTPVSASSKTDFLAKSRLIPVTR